MGRSRLVAADRPTGEGAGVISKEPP
jgi:hypothetical protein